MAPLEIVELWTVGEQSKLGGAKIADTYVRLSRLRGMLGSSVRLKSLTYTAMTAS